LLCGSGTEWLDAAMLVELEDRAAARGDDGGRACARAARWEEVEIHNWRFGGRPQKWAVSRTGWCCARLPTTSCTP
jgi:uncharacterized protein